MHFSTGCAEIFHASISLCATARCTATHNDLHIQMHITHKRILLSLSVDPFHSTCLSCNSLDPISHTHMREYIFLREYACTCDMYNSAFLCAWFRVIISLLLGDGSIP